MGGSMIWTAALGMLGVIGAVMVSFLGRQAQSEFHDWTPRVMDRLIERAVSRLAEDKRDRYREEWAGHVALTPGQVGKWWVAIGYLLASSKMRPPKPSRLNYTLSKEDKEALLNGASAQLRTVIAFGRVLDRMQPISIEPLIQHLMSTLWRLIQRKR